MTRKPTMTSRVRDYLSQRRALGYKLHREGRQLLNFAHYADQARHRGPLSSALALRWARLPRAVDRAYHARRLNIVRVFARHQAVLEPATQVPPRHVLGPASAARRLICSPLGNFTNYSGAPAHCPAGFDL